jgi:hypothetical protein
VPVGDRRLARQHVDASPSEGPGGAAQVLRGWGSNRVIASASLRARHESNSRAGGAISALAGPSTSSDLRHTVARARLATRLRRIGAGGPICSTTAPRSNPLAPLEGNREKRPSNTTAFGGAEGPCCPTAGTGACFKSAATADLQRLFVSQMNQLWMADWDHDAFLAKRTDRRLSEAVLESCLVDGRFCGVDMSLP